MDLCKDLSWVSRTLRLSPESLVSSSTVRYSPASLTIARNTLLASRLRSRSKGRQSIAALIHAHLSMLRDVCTCRSVCECSSGRTRRELQRGGDLLSAAVHCERKSQPASDRARPRMFSVSRTRIANSKHGPARPTHELPVGTPANRGARTSRDPSSVRFGHLTKGIESSRPGAVTCAAARPAAAKHRTFHSHFNPVQHRKCDATHQHQPRLTAGTRT